ncbi:hypothetical protein V6N13_082349 [Hibiscus sabdariffa]|uniref:Uncharacterized protein n=1 Tax=Hibiscus sabdariffa TaxID=183260 RepID=A0ABR2Q351_9ROSI
MRSCSSTVSKTVYQGLLPDAQVQPPLLESEVTPMFVETLTGPFYDHATKDFTNMALNGELILAAIKSGRLEEGKYGEHL